jgi:hypothetical protein
MRGRGWAGDVAVFDYDDDGFLDVFVPSMFGRGQLYHNNHDGTFSDVTATTLGATPHGAIGAKVFDYDGDGRLDLFVVDMHSDMWMGLDSRHSSEQLATQNQHRRFRSPAGPSVDEDASGFIQPQRAEFSVHGEDFNALLSATRSIATWAAEDSPRLLPEWRPSGRGVSPPGISTTTATKTRSSRRAWVTRSTTGRTS